MKAVSEYIPILYFRMSVRVLFEVMVAAVSVVAVSATVFAMVVDAVVS